VLVECNKKRVMVFVEASSLDASAALARLSVGVRTAASVDGLRARELDAPIAILLPPGAKHQSAPIVKHDLAERFAVMLGAVGPELDPNQRTIDDHLDEAKK
jgi:hypothetical protein